MTVEITITARIINASGPEKKTVPLYAIPTLKASILSLESSSDLKSNKNIWGKKKRKRFILISTHNLLYNLIKQSYKSAKSKYNI